MYSSTKTMCQRVWGFLYKQNPLRLRVLHKNASTEWSECLKEGCSQLRHLLHETGNVDAKDRAKTKRATSNKHPKANTHHDLLGKLPFFHSFMYCIRDVIGNEMCFPFFAFVCSSHVGHLIHPLLRSVYDFALKGCVGSFCKTTLFKYVYTARSPEGYKTHQARVNSIQIHLGICLTCNLAVR